MIAFAPPGSPFARSVSTTRHPFECGSCGAKEFVDVPDAFPVPAEARCDECAGTMEERGDRVRVRRGLDSGAPMAACDFPEQVLYNLGHEPVVVKSRRHYKELLRRRGLRNEWESGGAERGDWDKEGRKMARPGVSRDRVVKPREVF